MVFVINFSFWNFMPDESKIEFYFLRISAERLASDLRNFEKEIFRFSDEQLYAIVSHFDHIRDNMASVKKELEKRLNQ
jgi:hypothetical protein